MRQERDSDDSTQRSRLLRVTAAVDTLAQNQGRSLPSHPLSEIFLSFFIVDLVFRLLTFYTCACFARSSIDLGSY